MHSDSLWFQSDQLWQVFRVRRPLTDLGFIGCFGAPTRKLRVAERRNNIYFQKNLEVGGSCRFASYPVGGTFRRAFQLFRSVSVTEISLLSRWSAHRPGDFRLTLPSPIKTHFYFTWQSDCQVGFDGSPSNFFSRSEFLPPFCLAEGEPWTYYRPCPLFACCHGLSAFFIVVQSGFD